MSEPRDDFNLPVNTCDPSTSNVVPPSPSGLPAPTAAPEGLPHCPPQAPSPNSLDTLESSVKLPPQPDRSGNAPPLKGGQGFIHGGWAWLRNRVRRSLFRTSQPGHRVGAFDDCCREVNIYQNADDKSQFAVRCNRCHDRLCLPCAHIRSLVIRDALMAMVDGREHTFITLTLSGKNEDLTAVIDRLYKHFRALRQHPLWADNVKGGAAFLEIKWNEKAERWHPHLHIVADARFIPQGELSTVWHTITHDSFIVDIRRIREEKQTLAYVTKYASKPLNMTFARDEDKLDQAVCALKGRRLCLTFGSWYGTPLTNVEDDVIDDADWVRDPYRCTHVGHALTLLKLAKAGNQWAATVLQLCSLKYSPDHTRPPDG